MSPSEPGGDGHDKHIHGRRYVQEGGGWDGGGGESGEARCLKLITDRVGV